MKFKKGQRVVYRTGGNSCRVKKFHGPSSSYLLCRDNGFDLGWFPEYVLREIPPLVQLAEIAE